MNNSIGVIVGGSLSRGLEARLTPESSLEQLAAGRFLVVEGEDYDFHCLLVDLTLQTDPMVSSDPPPPGILQQALQGAGVGVLLSLRPMLVTPHNGAPGTAPEPARTIPGHFSNVRLAEKEDVEMIFGQETADYRLFSLGSPPEMAGIPVCMDFERFVERSSGIFGKSGTGKTFLARVVLAGIMRWNGASCLIFDFHDEYAREGKSETGAIVPPLPRLFPGQVEVVTLDDPAAKGSPLLIAHQDVEPEDISLLQNILNLPPSFPDVANAFALKHKDRWFTALAGLESYEEIKEAAEELGLLAGSVQACVKRVRRLARLPYLVKERPEGKADAANAITQMLLEGRHVIVEMGGADNELAYLFAANVITRRLHDIYIERTKSSLESGAAHPRNCVIVLEEAHLLVNRETAQDTIYGRIAREMRKFHVSLMLVDQRPSGIEPEVISQMGTKIIALLDDVKDLEAVLSGQQAANELRGMIARLATKQQALILGYAVPMPVVLSIRPYDADFAQVVGRINSGKRTNEELNQDVRNSFG